ncbi:hypothetical protein [Mycolicibacterium sp.]
MANLMEVLVLMAAPVTALLFMRRIVVRQNRAAEARESTPSQ